jgi:hypothetical protein
VESRKSAKFTSVVQFYYDPIKRKNMFCFHKYGRRTNDGYQYCSKCGKARKFPCVHKWKMIKEVFIYYGDGWNIPSINDANNQLPTGSKRIYECEFCGTMKTEKT